MKGSIHDPVRDIGPEFTRRFERDVMSFVRRLRRHPTDVDRLQAACDRLRREEIAPCT